MMKSAELRQAYLDFFEKREHRRVTSSPVIPHGDPTLLFTNAGMNQFKDVLMGREIRDYKRATSVQKCIRAGGKHNDLDEVGKDGRHLTLFEMLGNWSFGDYYKRDAIEWAWTFATEVLKFDKDRLYVSVYKDDDESAAIWSEHIGLAPERIARFGDIDSGDDENFWSMGKTGPCGPCTEIFFDHHPDAGPPNWAPGFDEARIVEFWNLVFMEFNRAEDGTLSPLPMQSVDTGMGLERVAAILQNVDNIFHTDGYVPLLLRIAELLELNVESVQEIYDHPEFSAFCVIADHIRTLSFSLADGGMFSNEGRGYVLRRILRRAVRYGRKLGFDAPFLGAVFRTLGDVMGDAYPELRATRDEIAELLRLEEVRFFRTIDRGISRFDELAKSTRQADSTVIDGAEAFKLYDTYGFPLDLTQIMAEEEGFTVDIAGFGAALKTQQERARKSDAHLAEDVEWLNVHDGVADQSVAWDTTQAQTRVLRLRERGDAVWEILLETTPFYAEAGGEVGDAGTIAATDGQFVFEVRDTQRTPSGLTHLAVLSNGTPTREALKGSVVATVDAQRRFLITCNHTATHLLHAALHAEVSQKAFQAGSLVAPDRLRFDYSFERPLTDDEVRRLEDHVNANIQKGLAVAIHTDLTRERAEEMGAMAIFGEKYGETVRVVEVPGESVELCGGCHVANSRDISVFRIASETGVAAGVRRIEAVTNTAAFERSRRDQFMLRELADTLKSDVMALPTRVAKLVEEQATTQRRAETLARRLAELTAGQIVDGAMDIEGVAVAAAKVDAGSRQELLFYADALRPKLADQSAVLLASAIDGKPALAVVVSDGLFKSRRLKAGDLINDVAPIVGGRGGGRPTLAQAGGNDLSKLNDALSAFTAKVAARLGQ